MSDPLTEAEIVQGLRRGERQAWEALCEQFSRRVWRYVARLVGRDENTVADVYQETLLAVAKAGRTLSEDTKLWPWLAAIGHNQAALFWRKSYRSRQVCLKGELTEAGPDQNPIENLMQGETVDLVRALLAEMNAEAAALLIGKYADGLSVAELVEAMGGTREGIRSRLARARREFRSRYEQAATFSDRTETAAVPELSPREGDLP